MPIYPYFYVLYKGKKKKKEGTRTLLRLDRETGENLAPRVLEFPEETLSPPESTK